MYEKLMHLIHISDQIKQFFVDPLLFIRLNYSFCHLFLSLQKINLSILKFENFDSLFIFLTKN